MGSKKPNPPPKDYIKPNQTSPPPPPVPSKNITIKVIERPAK